MKPLSLFRACKYALWLDMLCQDEYSEISEKFSYERPEKDTPVSYGAMPSALAALRQIISMRKSSRAFKGSQTTKDNCLDILRLSYGFCNNAHRTVPSAGGFYPLTLWLGRIVHGVLTCIEKYNPYTDSLEACQTPMADLEEAFRVYHVDFNSISWIILWSVRLTNIGSKYGARGYRFASLEVGHSAQMAILACCALKIQHVLLGGIIERKIRRNWLQVGSSQRPQYVLALR